MVDRAEGHGRGGCVVRPNARAGRARPAPAAPPGTATARIGFIPPSRLAARRLPRAAGRPCRSRAVSHAAPGMRGALELPPCQSRAPRLLRADCRTEAERGGGCGVEIKGRPGDGEKHGADAGRLGALLRVSRPAELGDRRCDYARPCRAEAGRGWRA